VAFGVPDDVLGERIKVTLSFRRDVNINAEALLSIVSRQMPTFMVPKEVQVLEELPKNQTGKLDRVLVTSAR
jgi:long-chain acyl-CoA synthetase